MAHGTHKCLPLRTIVYRETFSTSCLWCFVRLGRENSSALIAISHAATITPSLAISGYFPCSLHTQFLPSNLHQGAVGYGIAARVRVNRPIQVAVPPVTPLQPAAMASPASSESGKPSCCETRRGLTPNTAALPLGGTSTKRTSAPVVVRLLHHVDDTSSSHDGVVRAWMFAA